MKSSYFLRLPNLLACFLFLFTPAGVTASEEKASPIKAQYTAKQVSPSTYVVHGPLAAPNPENQGFMNNPAFIVGESGIIIIDVGSTVQVGEMVLALIKSVSGLPVVATFTTHIYGDHWLGNQAVSEAYPDAKHYAHPGMIEQANSGQGENWVSLMLNLTEGASAGTIYHAPTDTDAVHEGAGFTIAGKTMVVYHDELTYTQTNIALFFKDERVLFLGDTVMNNRLERMDDGSFKGLIAFLDKLRAINADVYVPGYGQSGNQDVIKTYQQFMQLVLDMVKAGYESGLADFEIKALIEEKIDNKAQWSGLEASLGKLVSLAYLEVEEDAY